MEVDNPARKTFRKIKQGSDSFRKEMIRHALAGGTPSQKQLAVEHLLDEGGRDNWRLLVRSFPKLPPGVQNSVVEVLPEYSDVSEELIEEGAQPETDNLLQIVGMSQSRNIASLAVTAIKNNSGETKENGVDAFLQLVKNYLEFAEDKERPGRKAASTRWFFIERILEIMVDYEEIMDRRLLRRLLDLGHQAHPPLLHILDDTSHPAHGDLKMVLRFYESGSVIDFLMKVYRTGTRSKQNLVERILNERNASELAPMVFEFFADIPHGALEAIAVQTDSLDWIRRISGYFSEGEKAPLDKVLRFVDQTEAPDDEKKEIYFKMLEHSDPDIREMVIDRFAFDVKEQDLEKFRRVLETESNRSVLESALEFGEQFHGEKRRRWLEFLLSSNNAEIRKQVSRKLSQRRFQQLMDAFDHIDQQQAQKVVRSFEQNNELTERIGDELQSLDRERRLKAIKLIQISEKTERFEEELYSLINDPDPRVRAAVVKAIGFIGSPDAIRVLIKALSDDDRRTRANAIEAFEEIGHPKLSRVLIPFLKDPDNRVRANAAKALWNLGHEDAVETLEDMLEEEPEMQMSALWAISEIGYTPAIDQVRNLAEEAEDPGIRKRAQNTLEDLEQEVESS